MIITPYKTGYVKLTAPRGVREIRTGSIYTTVICRDKPKEIARFEAVEPVEQTGAEDDAE